MDRGGPRARYVNAKRRHAARQAPSRSSGVGFLRVRENAKQARWAWRTMDIRPEEEEI